MKHGTRAPLRRLACLALAALMALALLPFSALASGEPGWTEAFEAYERDLEKQVMEYANLSLEGLEEFSFISYAPPEGVDLTGEDYRDGSGAFSPGLLPAGTLAVTVTRGGETAGPRVLPLPAGAYRLAFSDRVTSGPDTALTITQGEETALAYTLSDEEVFADLNDYVTGVALSVNGGAPVDLTGGAGEVPALRVGDEVEVKVGFAVDWPAKAGFRGGVPYSIDLPQALGYERSVEMPVRAVVDGQEVEAGVFALSKEDRTAAFTFDEGLLDEDLGHLSGSFSYSGKVLPAEGGEGDGLSFTVNGQVITVPIFVPETKTEIEKTGVALPGENGGVVRWTVTVPSPKDVFPAGLELQDRMTWEKGGPIHELRELERVEVDGVALGSGAYTLSDSGDGFALTLNEAVEGGTLTLVYTSNLSGAGLENLFKGSKYEGAYYTRTVVNTVRAVERAGEGGDGGVWGEASARVQTRVDLLNKVLVNDGAQEQTWRVTANASFMRIPAGTVLWEKPSGDLELAGMTVKRYDAPYRSVTDQANYVEDETAFTVDLASGTVTLKREINVPFLVEVTTRTKTSGVDQHQNKNGAELHLFGRIFTAEAAGGGQQAGSHLYKTGGGYDLTKGTASWNVYFGNTDAAAALTDVIQADQTLLADSVVLRKTDLTAPGQGGKAPGGTVVGKVDLSSGFNTLTSDGITFTFSYDSGTRTLRVETDRAVAGIYCVSYGVRVSNDVIYGPSRAETANMGSYSDRTIKNTASLTVGSKEYSAEDGQNQGGRNFNKTGAVYHAGDGTISWTIHANIKKLPYRADTFTIVDQLPSGLVPARDAEGNYRVTVSGLPEGYSSQVKYDEAANRLTIAILGGNENNIFDKTVTVDVVSAITDGGMGSIFAGKENGRTFRNQGYQHGEDLEGTRRWDGDFEDLDVKGVPLEKTSRYDADTAVIDWAVTLNPNHLAVLTGTEPMKVEDQLAITGLPESLSAQAFLGQPIPVLTRLPLSGEPEELPLRAGTEAPAPGGGSCYSYDAERLLLTVWIDPAAGRSTDAYRLTYATSLDLPDNYEGKEIVDIQNGVKWSGHEAQASSGEISLASVSATLSGKRYGKAALIKTDAETGEALAGARFGLYDETGKLVAIRTTGADGGLTFTRLEKDHTYTVRELAAPKGYVLNTQPRTVAAGGTLTFENTRIRGGITVTKVDALDETRKLEGAEFTLYVKATGEPYRFTDGQPNPAATGADGTVLFANLPQGEYVVRETRAPEGYLLNTAWEETAAVSKADEQIALTCADQPRLGKLVLTKLSEKDAAGGQRLLPGARFELLAADGETVVRPERETDERGQIAFEDLHPGAYYLRETAAPEGYDRSTELHEVHISAERAEVYVSLENARTPSGGGSDPGPSPGPNPPSGGEHEREEGRDEIKVVIPSDLTPEEVTELIEEGYTPLSDLPDLTPEEIIEQNIPLADLPDLEVPRAAAPDLPQTGDDAPLWLWAALLAGSLAGLAVLCRRRGPGA